MECDPYPLATLSLWPAASRRNKRGREREIECGVGAYSLLCYSRHELPITITNIK
ncbi:hypothetical protein HYC85_021074 [Camellia sinensis]|uniref:Uncharacterized protein n=1 Tax=Camellia sinensis TaxID=4442 RepID=A0A7J7GHD0_CAMSI|nr:hypothetical protein HYC85_021074 [Camellia sinensis]